MRAHWLIAALCSWFACLDAVGQDLFTIEEGAGPPLVRFDAAAMGDRAGRFLLSGFPLGRGSDVTLELERFRVASERTRFVIGTNDGDVPVHVDPDRFAFYRGRVIGRADSHVFLALGEGAAQGRVSLGSATYEMRLTEGGAVRVAPEAAARPMTPLLCEVGRGELSGPVSGNGAAIGADAGRTPAQPLRGAEPRLGLRQVEMAVDGDFELFSLFGHEQATFDYMLLVYGAVADLVYRDLNARIDLVFVRVWTTAQDPYGPVGGMPRNIPTPYDHAQLLSGTTNSGTGGGAAGICASLSWVGNALGFIPNAPGPHVANQDIIIAAHELGHCLGAPHTHDMRVDECDDPRTQTRRNGIMSYCYYFSGGYANTDMRFHAASQSRISVCMRLPFYSLDCNQNGVDDSNDIASGFSADVNGNGVPDECEDCNGNMVLDDEDIASGTSLDLNGNGVPDECEMDCNGNGFPDDMDLELGTGLVVFHDNFETNRGWRLENLGATDGDWERAVPVNDPNWTFAPPRDSDGSGRCMLTDNAPGQSDVDGGATRIVSPVIDMSGGGYSLSVDYYMTERDSSDRLLLEGSADGITWVRIIDWRNTLDSWRRFIADPDWFDTVGLSQTATMQFRLTATDAPPDTAVEAAIDRFIIGKPFDTDLNGNNVPDSCEADCNGNQISDYNEIVADMTLDINRNAVLDSCENCDGDEFTDLEEIDGAGDVWAALPEEDIIRQYHGITGVLVRDSDAGVLMSPSDVLITDDARVLVSSTGDDRIVEFDRRGQFVRDLVASGLGGLSQPGAMVVSPRRTLLAASTGSDEVLEYDLESGAFLSAFVSGGAGGLTEPYGLTFGPNGGLYVTSVDASGASVLEFDGASGAFVRVFIDSAASGQASELRDIVFTNNGRTFVVAPSNLNTTLAFDGATGAPIGSFESGTFGGKLQRPWGLVVGPDLDVYVTSDIQLDAPAGSLFHLTDPRLIRYDGLTGYLIRALVQRRDSRLNSPGGFDFLPTVGDCNLNMLPDECDISSGYSMDLNGNGVPDECETCYADCDQSTGAEVLDVFDFLCFQDAFLTNDPWACGCDTMSGAGVCDVFDYLCFVDSFMNGCP